MKETKGVNRMWQLYKMGGVTPAIASMLGAQNAQQMAFMRSMNKDLRKQAMLDTPFDEMETIVFDLETTGFYPYNGDEIISFGALLLKGGVVQEDKFFYSLVNPKRKVPLHITELTGITSGMAEEAPDLLDVLHSFMEFCGRRLLIAHGSGHDKQFLNAALWRTSKVNLSHRVLDTMMVAKWLNPGREAYGLDELLEEEGIAVTQRHHALEDCRMQAQLWLKYLDRIRSRNIKTLGDLYAYLSQH
ncbi:MULTISPECIES: exonuclease domain-containing protein [unclassified Paenibacillus]|uniref:exonuclease domain-containing protein n=1 Tax=unclassified Paenibacillus TaxID=185978 RepID=UPI00095555FF|nr:MULTISPECIES: exonuclease domain-containing protein [unclassified Paenibacillus]ASS64878.1 3'-5' exonuclease [Paenibacillus sp. RUD330]SIR02946.1 DNA polymerase-3 subunit epsilon [Paenibacillus sp. RU4X]SIR32394.1 DNA polymerase-3 subunit epsilon [Paenibacillus sp. RU4T]